MVLIDLKKAFDIIHHVILLNKMNCLGFSISTVAWFNSYLSNGSFIVNIGKAYSSPGKLFCGVPQGSILGPLLFLLYVNDMPKAVNSALLLYAGDTCLIYRDTKTTEDQLNRDCNSFCEWFIDNILSIHFGKEKQNLFYLGQKGTQKNHTDSNIKYGDIKIKQHSKVTYLGCILDNSLSGESMATKLLGLVNGRLKFLHWKQRFLTYLYANCFVMLSFSLTMIILVLLGTPHSVKNC